MEIVLLSIAILLIAIDLVIAVVDKIKDYKKRKENEWP
jgi:hypothetical protein